MYNSIGALFYVIIYYMLFYIFDFYHEIGHAREAKKLGDKVLITLRSRTLGDRYFRYKDIDIYILKDQRIQSKTYVKSNFKEYTNEQIRKICFGGVTKTGKYIFITFIFAVSGFLFSRQIGETFLITWFVLMILMVICIVINCKKIQFNDFAIIKNPAAFREYMQHTTKDTYEEINKIINDIMKE
jgi:hypothetical protein